MRNPREERGKKRLHAREVIRFEQAEQADALSHRLLLVGRPSAQNAARQRLAHFAVRIPQRVIRRARQLLLARNGQVAGLEQQRLDADIANLERRQQRLGGLQALQIGKEVPALGQQIHQERGRAGFEPVRPKVALLEQQQQIEGVVHRIAAPVVSVVPAADLVPIQPRQFSGKYRVDVRIRVTTDRRAARIHRDVIEVVQARKQTHFAELRHPGEHGELDVRILPLDHRIQVAQPVAHLSRHLRPGQVVQDRLVVLIDQHHHPLPVKQSRLFDQRAETAGNRALHEFADTQALRVVGEQIVDSLIERRPTLHHPFGKADPDHRIAHRPIPATVAMQPAKQRLVAREQFPQRIDEQALAEPTRARQEVVLALGDQTQRKTGLVDVIAVVLADLAKGLDADGQLLAGHGGHAAETNGDSPIIRLPPATPPSSRSNNYRPACGQPLTGTVIS